MDCLIGQHSNQSLLIVPSIFICMSNLGYRKLFCHIHNDNIYDCKSKNSILFESNQPVFNSSLSLLFLTHLKFLFKINQIKCYFLNEAGMLQIYRVLIIVSFIILQTMVSTLCLWSFTNFENLELVQK